jgi:hypothetical protein
MAARGGNRVLLKDLLQLSDVDVAHGMVVESAPRGCLDAAPALGMPCRLWACWCNHGWLESTAEARRSGNAEFKWSQLEARLTVGDRAQSDVGDVVRV